MLSPTYKVHKAIMIQYQTPQRRTFSNKIRGRIIIIVYMYAPRHSVILCTYLEVGIIKCCEIPRVTTRYEYLNLSNYNACLPCWLIIACDNFICSLDTSYCRLPSRKKPQSCSFPGPLSSINQHLLVQRDDSRVFVTVGPLGHIYISQHLGLRHQGINISVVSLAEHLLVGRKLLFNDPQYELKEPHAIHFTLISDTEPSRKRFGADG